MVTEQIAVEKAVAASKAKRKGGKSDPMIRP